MERNSIRLRNFDYDSRGVYFITICSYQREHLFGGIEQGKLQLTDLGTIILEEWHRMGEPRQIIQLDAFVVMPNHIHGIICIQPAVGAGLASPNLPIPLAHSQKELFLSQTKLNSVPMNAPANSLGAMIGGFKSAVSRVARTRLSQPHLQVWQRNSFERVIRNERELNAVREYIALNPQNWSIDLDATSNFALHDCVFSSLEAAA